MTICIKLIGGTSIAISLNQDTIKQAKEIIFSRKTEKIFHPSLRFNNNIVSQTPYQKHLASQTRITTDFFFFI